MKGFTLIETMVAVAIITLAVSGPLSAVNSGLVASYTARDQMTASYLAQEGVEYVRAMRDDVYLTNYQSNSTQNAWSDFINTSNRGVTGNIGSCIAPAICTIDPTQPMGNALAACGSSCGPLYTLGDGRYTQSTNNTTKTIFTRTMQATSISATEEKITSTVSWLTHGQPFHVTVTDHLTPWH